MAQIIPISSAPNQQVTARLTVDGASLTLALTFRYNRQAAFWTMDISDRLGNALVSGIPLVTGDWPAANMLAPYSYLGIGSAYIINQSGVASDRPNESNLGTDFLLLWDDTAA